MFPQIEREQLTISTPSADNISITELSFLQQTKLLSASLDGYENALKYINLLNKIILDNCQQSVLICDRIPILLALRIQAVGSTYTTEDNEQIDLTPYCSNFCKIDNSPVVVEHKNIKLTLQIPTIEREYEHIEKCLQFTELAVENVVYNEFLKFITEVNISGLIFDLTKHKLADCYKLLDALPAPVYTKIVKYISNVTFLEQKMLVYGDVEIEMPPSFFSA